MKMLPKILSVATLWIFVLFPGLYAQSVPVTAKVRNTGEVVLNGKSIETHVEEGVFYRSFTGVELRQWLTTDGNPVHGKMAMAAIYDAPNDVNYWLDSVAHNAYVQPASTVNLPDGSSSGQPQPALGESSVEGIPCSIFPVYTLQSGQRILIGRTCKSKQYNLVLRMEYTKPTKDPTEKQYRTTTEYFDVQIGVEPDPKLFDLTAFTIYRPDEKK
jgi:hypothetical protein